MDPLTHRDIARCFPYSASRAYDCAVILNQSQSGQRLKEVLPKARRFLRNHVEKTRQEVIGAIMRGTYSLGDYVYEAQRGEHRNLQTDEIVWAPPGWYMKNYNTEVRRTA